MNHQTKLSLLAGAAGVEQVTLYKASDGSTHDSQFDALRTNLQNFIIAAHGNNPGIARVTTRAILACLDDFAKLIEALKACDRPDDAPPPTAAAPVPTVIKVPQTHARARCMGGRHCNHGPDECTADPNYQLWIAAKRRWHEAGNNAAPFIDQPIETQLEAMIAVNDEQARTSA